MHCNVNYSGMLLGLQIEDSPRQLRQSRRIAQMKIKEQAGIRLNQAQYQEGKLTWLRVFVETNRNVRQ